MPGAGNIRRIGVLTGGGDCPGLNAVIRAVTKTAITEHGLEVLGIEDGYLGLIEGRVRPLTYESASNILNLGGTILGASNKANPAHFFTGRDDKGEPVYEDVRNRVVRNVDEHGIDALICIGGDGTMSGAVDLIDKGLKIVGVPKTIDNDVAGTDTTFGFDTAVSIAAEALDRIRTTASSHHRVMFVEMMGRNAGWITLFAGAASGADIILIPEIEFTVDAICERCVYRSEHHKAYTLIAVSEGAKPAGGQQVVDRLVHESPDPVRLGGISEVLSQQIAQCIHLECRATILGHVQRGGTPTAHDRVLATQLGHQAMKLVAQREFGRMAAIHGGQMSSVPIADVANQQKLVPLNHSLVEACRAVNTSFGD